MPLTCTTVTPLWQPVSKHYMLCYTTKYMVKVTVVMHSYNSSTQEAEVGLISVSWKPTCSIQLILGREGYTVRPCLKRKSKQTGRQTGEIDDR